MRILWVATKAPSPPVDGGRLLLANTLSALEARGHDLTLVAPIAEAADRERIENALRPICRPVLVAARPRPFRTSITTLKTLLDEAASQGPSKSSGGFEVSIKR